MCFVWKVFPIDSSAIVQREFRMPSHYRKIHNDQQSQVSVKEQFVSEFLKEFDCQKRIFIIQSINFFSKF
jgi:hypothetical protein